MKYAPSQYRLKDRVELKTFVHVSFFALAIPLPLMSFATEEITGCTNKAAKEAIKAGRNLSSCFLFHVLLFQ